MLLSLDGFAAGRHRDNLRRGIYADPDGFAAFAHGYVVERATPVDPALTAVSHTSIATGSFPAVTGIVSNRFRLPGTSILQSVSGFDLPLGAEPLWQTFRRQGKRAGVLTFPGCDGTTATRTADFGMVYVNDAEARPRVLTLESSCFVPLMKGREWASFSPPRRATFAVEFGGARIPASATFTLTALDSSNDDKVNYDTIVVNGAAWADGTATRVHAGEWFPLRVRSPHADGGTRTVGGWCFLKALPPDLADVVIYRGGFYATRLTPGNSARRSSRPPGFGRGRPTNTPSRATRQVRRG